MPLLYIIQRGGAVLSDLLNYSTEEKVVGVFTNGNKIYQKTFSGTYTNNDVLLSDVEFLISLQGMISISGIWRAVPYFELYHDMKYIGNVNLNSSNQIVLCAVASDEFVTTSICITVQYTKRQ